MLVRGAPGALAATKEMLRREPAGSMAADFATMAALSAEHFAGQEGREGMAAFAAKRPGLVGAAAPDLAGGRSCQGVGRRVASAPRSGACW